MYFTKKGRRELWEESTGVRSSKIAAGFLASARYHKCHVVMGRKLRRRLDFAVNSTIPRVTLPRAVAENSMIPSRAEPVALADENGPSSSQQRSLTEQTEVAVLAAKNAPPEDPPGCPPHDWSVLAEKSKLPMRDTTIYRRRFASVSPGASRGMMDTLKVFRRLLWCSRCGEGPVFWPPGKPKKELEMEGESSPLAY